MAEEIETQIDEALEVVGGFGPFQWISVGVFCIMILPVSFQILIVYFLASEAPWKCARNSSLCTLNGTYSKSNTFRCTIPRGDWEFKEKKEFSIVTQFDIYCGDEWLLELCTGIFFLGAGIGGLLMGNLADSFGRRRVLFFSLTMLILIGGVSATVPNIYMLIACRFVTGICYVGSLGQLLVMSMELVKATRRTFAMNIIWICYSLALCIVGLKAYYISTWRILSLACTLPYLPVLLFYKHVPESLRWLIVKARREEADVIFKVIAKKNKRPTSFPSINIDIQDGAVAKSSFRDLFRPLRFALKTGIQTYAWFVTSMVYYGLSLAASDLGGSIYLNFALVSLMECPGHIIGAFLSNKFGRKKTAIIPMALSGLLCICIPYIPRGVKFTSVILDMFGKMFITMCYSCIYVWSAEIYPTHCRAKGIGLLQVFEMLGGMSAPFIVKSLPSKSIAFLIFGSCAFLGSGLMTFLPETRGNGVLPQ